MRLMVKAVSRLVKGLFAVMTVVVAVVEGVRHFTNVNRGSACSTVAASLRPYQDVEDAHAKPAPVSWTPIVVWASGMPFA